MFKGKAKQSRQRPAVDSRPRIPFARYYARAAAVQQRPARRSPAWLNRLAAWLLIVALLAGGLFNLYVRSVTVEPPAAALRSLSAYQLAAEQITSGWRYRAKPTFDRVGLEAQMRARFPEIIGLSTRAPWIGQNQRLLLTVSRPEILLKSNGRTWVVDERGRAVADVADPSVSKALKLPAVDDQSGFSFPAGGAALSGHQVEFITTIVSQLTRAKVPIESLSLPPVASQLHLKTNLPYVVKFSMEGDPLKQSGSYLAVRQQLISEAFQPSRYVDVRVEERVFVL